MDQERVDCEVFQKNLTKGVYTREVCGLWVMATKAPSAHHRGVAIFYREPKHFASEELRLHGPNIISFQLETWRRRWHVVGCYIAPSDDLTIEDVTAAIRSWTYRANIPVAGDLNPNIMEPEGTPAIADKLAASGLEDMGLHFLPRRKPWFQDR